MGNMPGHASLFFFVIRFDHMMVTSLPLVGGMDLSIFVKSKGKEMYPPGQKLGSCSRPLHFYQAGILACMTSG